MVEVVPTLVVVELIYVEEMIVEVFMVVLGAIKVLVVAHCSWLVEG